jgi:predicted nucleic acid-binding protein
LTLLIDAGPLVALADPDEPRRDQILEILTSEPEALVIPAQTTAEVDYLGRPVLGSVSPGAK